MKSDEIERLERQIQEIEELQAKKEAGEISDADARRLEQLTSQARSEANAQTFGGLAALVLVAAVAVWWFWESDDSAESEKVDAPREMDWSLHAVVQCEKEVKRRLKAPSTAKFVTREQEVYKMGESEWGVIGAVDAQNSFGATVRSEFACKLSREEYGQWTFHDVLVE